MAAPKLVKAYQLVYKAVTYHAAILGSLQEVYNRNSFLMPQVTERLNIVFIHRTHTVCLAVTLLGRLNKVYPERLKKLSQLSTTWPIVI